MLQGAAAADVGQRLSLGWSRSTTTAKGKKIALADIRALQ